MSYQAVINNLTPVMDYNPQRILEQLQGGAVYVSLGVNEQSQVTVHYLYAVKDDILCGYNFVGTNEAKLRLNLAVATHARSETVNMIVCEHESKVQHVLFACSEEAINDATYYAYCSGGGFLPLTPNLWEYIRQQFAQEPEQVIYFELPQNPG